MIEDNDHYLFSSEYDENFERHLKRLAEAAKHCPRKTIKELRRFLLFAKLWYGNPNI